MQKSPGFSRGEDVNKAAPQRPAKRWLRRIAELLGIKDVESMLDQ